MERISGEGQVGGMERDKGGRGGGKGGEKRENTEEKKRVNPEWSKRKE